MATIIPLYRVRSTPFQRYNGKELTFSSINYFFGSNGSGKSTTLRQLMDAASNHIKQSHPEYFTQFIPAMQHQGEFTDREVLDDVIKLEKEASQSTVANFYQLLTDYPEVQIRVRDALQRYLGRSPNVVRRGIKNAMSFIREEEGLAEYNVQSESDGLRRLTILLGYIYHPKCLVLGIDEPEIHLHPDMVTFLIEEIEYEVGRGKQFFLTTHSAEMLKVGKKDTFAYFYFNLRDKLADCEIIELASNGAHDIMLEIGLGFHSSKRAFFFAPQTLFVEGVYDEAFFNKLAVEKNIKWPRRLHMVEVTGVSNTAKYVMLWDKLGKTFCAILDAPKARNNGDAVWKEIGKLCDYYSIPRTSSYSNIRIELKKKNILIADYKDVLEVQDSSGNTISRKWHVIANNWSRYRYTKQLKILKQALSLNKPQRPALRQTEREWLDDIRDEISGLLQDNASMPIKDRLAKVADELKLHHSHAEVKIYRSGKKYLQFKYRVSQQRYLVLEYSKDSANHKRGIRAD